MATIVMTQMLKDLLKQQKVQPQAEWKQLYKERKEISEIKVIYMIEAIIVLEVIALVIYLNK